MDSARESIAFVCYITGGRCLLCLLEAALPAPPEYSTAFPHTGPRGAALARARVYRVYKQRRQPPRHFSAGRLRLNVGHRGAGKLPWKGYFVLRAENHG